MATVTKKSLKATLDNVVKGDNDLRIARETANQTLLDTAMSSTYSKLTNTVSASGVVNIELIQPANTIIEDILPIVTSTLTLEEATVGFRVSSGSYGNQDVVAAVDTALSAASTEVAAGVGTSIHAKISQSLEGGGVLTITKGAGYTATERPLFCQVSCSNAGVAGQGFKTNTGEFRVVAKYYNI